MPSACVRSRRTPYKADLLPRSHGRIRAAISETDVYNITLECTQALERIILAYPDQWPWQHNRWRTRKPAGPLDIGLICSILSVRNYV